jgi:hypothetical protein
MNDILSKRILALPQVLQDIIGEFHVEHRANMKQALEVIISMELTCFICGVFINDRPRDGVVYMRKRTFCCSKKCEIIGIQELPSTF